MSDDEKWVMHLDEGDLVHFAPSSFNVCDPHAEFPDGSVTLYFQQLEMLRDALNEFLPPRRAPVTPIPVSEPPWDEDWVLPMWVGMDGESLAFHYEPLTGMEFNAQQHHIFDSPYAPVTHYLLLRKGE